MNSPRLAVRAEQAILDRLDRLAVRLSRPGVTHTRSDAARTALLRGLDALEREIEAPTTRGAKPARKPAKKTKPRK